MTERHGLPWRKAGESCVDYHARVALLYERHLDDCDDCNYDKDCVACEADTNTGHSCSCYWPGTDNGYGHKLRLLVQAAKRDADRERAGE